MFQDAPFLMSLLLVFLFDYSVFAQTEIAAQRFEQGLTNANRSRREQALKGFQNALEKYKFAPDSSDEFAAKINYNIGVCLYPSGRDDYVAVESRGPAETKTGKGCDNQYCYVFRLAAGKVREITEYFDSTMVERMLE